MGPSGIPGHIEDTRFVFLTHGADQHRRFIPSLREDGFEFRRAVVITCVCALATVLACALGWLGYEEAQRRAALDARLVAIEAQQEQAGARISQLNADLDAADERTAMAVDALDRLIKLERARLDSLASRTPWQAQRDVAAGLRERDGGVK